jgi:hypothetical protein
MLEDMISSPAGRRYPGCRLENIRISGGNIRANRVCIDQAGRSRVTIEGRYGSERINYREDEERFDMKRGPDGDSDRSIVRITTGERTGDC